jgi:hypothetical protein
MRRAGEIIATRYKVFGQIFKVRENWKEIAGEVLAAHVEPVFIKNKVLHVLCDSPAWVQQIGILSSAITTQVKSVVGIRVEKVEGKFGMAQRIPPRQKALRVFKKPDIDPEDILKVKDPELAKAIRQLMESTGPDGG